MKKIYKVIFVVAVILILIAIAYRTFQPEIEVVGTQRYVVSNGDTLWDIAEEREDKSIYIWDYIDLIYESNKGLTSYIEPGQIITLPIVKKIDLIWG